MLAMHLLTLSFLSRSNAVIGKRLQLAGQKHERATAKADLASNRWFGQQLLATCLQVLLCTIKRGHLPNYVTALHGVASS